VCLRTLVKEININIALKNDEKLYIQLYESQRIVVLNDDKIRIFMYYYKCQIYCIFLSRPFFFFIAFFFLNSLRLLRKPLAYFFLKKLLFLLIEKTLVYLSITIESVAYSTINL